MATENYIRVCRSLGVGDLRPQPEKPIWFFAKKKPETLQREASEARYNSRSNACTVCFTARSKSGQCAC